MKRGLAAGQVVDGFRLEERLHRGGLGAVWRVSKAGIDLPIVMKLPLLGPGDDPLDIVAYEVEQMLMPRLTGAHVPRFIAAGDFDGPYIVMELISGHTLKERLDALPLPPEEVAAIGAEIADALDDIHRQKVVHLDIKPSNIMIREGGDVVLLDFGLSHHLELPDLPAEELDGPIGTGAYIAPEQVLGVRDDPRSDLFALGVVLYFLATGVRPFGEPRTVGQWRKRLTREPVPPRRRKPELPPWLQEVILHCLEIDPRQRYQSATHVAFDLRHPELVPLTERAERSGPSGLLGFLRRWTRQAHARLQLLPEPRTDPARPPIIVAAVDLDAEQAPVAQELRDAIGRFLSSTQGARLACVNIMKQSRIKLDVYEDAEGHNLHLLHLAELKHWAAPLAGAANRITYHVIEAMDPAGALIDFAQKNKVNHILMGARANSALRRYLGSVSAKVVAEAPCSVTVIRAGSPSLP
jgi:nucleotide-binding universal stress UspA family protein